MLAVTYSMPSSSHLSQKKRSLSQQVIAISHVQVQVQANRLTRESVHLVHAIHQQSVTRRTAHDMPFDLVKQQQEDGHSQ